MSIKPLMIAVLLSILSTTACVHGGKHAQDIKNDVEDSVYLLKGFNKHGTGFVVKNVKSKKLIVTNAHVCDDNSIPIMTAISSTGKQTAVRILHKSSITDLCILQAPSRSKAISLANNAYKDEKVFAVGYPLGPFMIVSEGRLKGFMQFQASTSVPISQCIQPKHKIETQKIPIRKRDGSKGFRTKSLCTVVVDGYFTTVPVDRGFSGSPLINKDGEVVGVIMGYRGNISWGHAVSLDALKKYLGYKIK